MADKDAIGTREAEQILLSSDTFTDGVERVRRALRPDTASACFDALLARYGVSTSEAVRRADLDPDFGRQILRGTRGTRRDNYIRLAIGIGLSFQDTQSLLSSLGVAPLYALRERDAAILFCIQNRYDLMDTQLMLHAHDLLPLSDEENTRDRVADGNRITTGEAEAILLSENAYEEAADKIGAIADAASAAEYFDALLKNARMNRATLLKESGVNPNIGFHVLRGDRAFKRREPYLRMAFALGLSLRQTQRMLSHLKMGRLYPLREQDAAILYCLDRRYSLAQTQRLLSDHALAPL